jgi:hypothetical protein
MAWKTRLLMLAGSCLALAGSAWFAPLPWADVDAFGRPSAWGRTLPDSAPDGGADQHGRGAVPLRRTPAPSAHSAADLAGPPRYAPGDLAGLPAPVRRYLSLALRSGQPMLAALRVDHAGRRRSLAGDAAANADTHTPQWQTFTSTQRLTMRPTSSPWDGAIFSLPEAPLQVLQRRGPGIQLGIHTGTPPGIGPGRVRRAGLAGVIGLIDEQDDDEHIRDALMRYLALAAWYPTVLLPSQGVSWQAVDADSACATLQGPRVSVTLLFHFGADGLIDTVQVPQRSRAVRQVRPGRQAERADGGTAPDSGTSSADDDGSRATPWQARFWNPAWRKGMQVPQDAELAWLLPAGPRPYWLGRMTRTLYEFEP